MRPHIKMLSGNYLTFEVKSSQSGGSDQCRLCFDGAESLEHLIAQCVQLEDIRNRITTTLTNILTQAEVEIGLSEFSTNELSRFILDPSSMSLSRRVNINDPILPQLFRISRDYCYAIDKTRLANLTVSI